MLQQVKGWMTIQFITNGKENIKNIQFYLNLDKVTVIMMVNIFKGGGVRQDVLCGTGRDVSLETQGVNLIDLRAVVSYIFNFIILLLRK